MRLHSLSESCRNFAVPARGVQNSATACADQEAPVDCEGSGKSSANREV